MISSYALNAVRLITAPALSGWEPACTRIGTARRSALPTLKKAAKAVHEKAIEMLPLKELTDLTGYVRGGCTCIGMKKQFPVVMDESALKLPKVMVSGGRRGSQMELSPEDLMKAAGGSFADVII